jgi:SAM-dependent methyltransferase
VKAILNLIGVQRGETVLDPMAGSGTLCIEAAINGIHSIGIDVSPFCVLMMRAKTQALDVNANSLAGELNGLLDRGDSSGPRRYPGKLFREHGTRGHSLIDKLKKAEHGEIAMLCYLDAMGYAARRASKTATELLPVIVGRYLAAIRHFQVVKEDLGIVLGRVDVRAGDARTLDLPDDSVDAIVTSPPYSFAIDYAENDRPQLEYLGYDIGELKTTMVGLTGGRSKSARIAEYFKDMRRIFGEMARVLKPGRCCVVVIGSNEIQTGGIRHEVEFAKFGDEVGLELYWNMVRPIEGIHNSMRDEYVMFFKKR